MPVTTTHAPNVALLLQSDPLLQGGVARVVMNLANGFSSEGLSVDLVTTGSVGVRPDDLSPDVRLVQLGSSGLKSAFLPIVRYLRETRPGTVLSSMEHLNILTVWARALARVETRLVISTHGHLSQRLQSMWGWRERTFLPLLISRSYAQADAIVAVSKGVADDLRRFIPGGEIRHIYNPVVSASVESAIERGPEPPELGFPDPVVLGAGRFTPQKDFPLLMEAFALAREGRKMRLVLLGDGALQEELRGRAHSLGITDETVFPGMVRNPFPYLRRATVFVLSSRWEGFGNVIVEALACGTPVVSTDCPSGPAEILENGKYGLLTPVGDATAMADAILKTLDDPPDPDFLKARARSFSAEASVRQYREVLGI